MTDAWVMDNGPDTTGCELGQHDWAAWADEGVCDSCEQDDCFVTCAECGKNARMCDLVAGDPTA